MWETLRRQVQVGSWVLVLVFALAAVWLVQSIDQMNRTGNVSDTVMVSGEGKIVAKPDIAVTDLTISVLAPTAAGAQSQANVKSNAVVAFLKSKGIDEKDIKTSGYNIYPEYNWVENRNVLQGYRVRQTFTVKIRDIDNASTALDGVVDAGVNEVGGITFSIDEPDKLREQARALAIANAKAKADVLRDQLGIRLGRIVSFSEGEGGVPVVMYAREAAYGGGIGGGGPAPAIPTGENEIVVNVTLTYQIR